MAKALKSIKNGLNIRFIKSSKEYFITQGNMHIRIDSFWAPGFKTLEEAVRIAESLFSTSIKGDWITNKKK